MFTGIIESLGVVKSTTMRDGQMQLVVFIEKDQGAKLGDSIAINGACMTIAKCLQANTYVFDVSLESLTKTNLGLLKEGEIVNIERSMQITARLDGHFVSGHIDSMGIVSKMTSNGQNRLLYFSYPQELDAQIVSKGSISVNGVSLTVIAPEKCQFHATIVPHTWENTNLKYLSVGTKVNLETDILAKYVYKILGKKNSEITEELLLKAGF